jgi:iron complex outermembrane receptor protein
MQGGLNRWRVVFAVSAFIVFSVAASSCLQAQPAGDAVLSGTVLDQAGKAIPSAVVTLKRESAGLIRTLNTDGDGRFSATGLPAGTYVIEVSAPGFAITRREGLQLATGRPEDISISLKIAELAQTVNVEAVVSVAAQLAPSGNTLDATSARTEITGQFIKNFTSPLSDFNEVIQMAPGTYSVNANGVGLGQGKTFFRGFKDGLYTMTFDGIPFQDTNDPTHHSWAFFPGQWIGGVDFDRSPGGASAMGPTNFGGSINLLSQDLQPSPDVRASASYGSFNTRLLDLSLDSGQFFPNQKSSLFIDIHHLLSDGYQTYNYQKRVAGSMKYQYKITDKTVLSIFGGLIDVWTNTPDSNAPTRADVAKFGDNYLLNGDPSSPNYYGYSFYHIQTDFAYIGLKTELGHGWRLDNKVNTYRYWNKQNLEKNLTKISTTSAVDKLNGANHFGDITSVSQESRWGIFRAGAWYDWAYTDRYQYTSSPFNWADNLAPLFHEHFITQTLQPFAEYEWRPTQKLVITAGLKDAHYGLYFNQYQDNGKTVGCLGGVYNPVTTGCVGGVAFVSHSVGYNSWLPSAAARYRLKRNWSVYAQFGEGSVIPPTSVFDVPLGAVEAPPKPTLAKTYQAGSVIKFNRWTLDVDAYYIHFQNPYAAVNDPNNFNEPVYVPTGPSNTKGIEAESNIFVGHGVSLYLNGTKGAARYQRTGLWVANAPSNTETVGLTWQQRNWGAGFFDKRVGKLYNDNGSVNQAVPIDPFNVANVFVNYTVKTTSFLRGSRIGLSVNNLFDSHSIAAITPGNGPTATVPYAPSGGDFLTLLPGRSVMISLTVGYAPKR